MDGKSPYSEEKTEKMKKILAIGNSFSEDAARYLHQTAKAAGVDTKVVNLFIGGCPLERHWKNIETGEAAYQYQLNGVLTERHVSIEEALQEDDWDYIVTQQASHDSGWQDTYEPFLGLILEYLKEKTGKKDTACGHRPEILLHETWAYEHGSTHSNFMRYHRSQEEMFERLRKCYHAMAEKYGLRLIPSGEVIQYVRGKDPFIVPEGGISLCRDGFHMSYLYGRYLLACVWGKTLFGIRAEESDYIPEPAAFPEKADEKLVKRIRCLADEYWLRA